jgi:hypothetical protein
MLRSYHGWQKSQHKDLKGVIVRKYLYLFSTIYSVIFLKIGVGHFEDYGLNLFSGGFILFAALFLTPMATDFYLFIKKYDTIK